MIYLEETLNLVPASPEALDSFIDFTQKRHIPLCQRLGARLVAAWFSNIEWFCQVTQVTEFDDIEALKGFRIKASQDRAWGEYLAQLEELAPERRSRLLEPLGPIPPETLHKVISESQQSPVGGYNLAILEVGADKMSQFKTALTERAGDLPIVASWRPIAGSPNEVIDVWKALSPQVAYQPANEQTIEFFRMVRELAPRERVLRVITLPYSPLR